MGPTIDVVVPTYGNWPITRSCLQHLRAQDVAHRLIVVDDHGPDDTADRVRSEFPEATVIALPENRGFAAACNAGIRAGDGEIVVLVNTDVDAEPDLLRRLAEPFVDDRLGSACPLLLKPDGRVDAYGIACDATMAGFVRFAGADVATALNRPSATLLGPYGAVAAYRRAALDEVGLLDEGIFMYGEELDLALRLNAAGWTTSAVPEARAVHIGGASSGRGSATQRRRAGFGRGYLLRAYRVLLGRHAVRAIATEAIVCAGDALLSRDLASTIGRVRGWRAGARAARRPHTIPAVDRRITFLRSLQLRVGDRRA